MTLLPPTGGVLPNIVFFEPTPKFLKLMSTDLWLRYRRVVDVGAGQGRMSRLLKEKGVRVHAIDVNHRCDPEVEVEITHGEKFWYEDGDICIVARPCHGTGFARNSLVQAIDCGALAFYIGLPKNVKNDLEDLVYRRFEDKVGKDGEVMYQVFGKPDQMHTYTEVKLSNWKDFSWMKESGSRYVNENGGGFPRDIGSIETRKSIKMLHIDQMRANKDDYLKPELNSGWITHDGQWLGAEERMHDTVIRVLLGIPVRQAEELGFVRCYGEVHNRMLWSKPNKKRLTPRQKQLLVEKGYNPDDWGMDDPSDAQFESR